MPQVINLEMKDDIAFIRARLIASADRLVLVVAPKGISVLRDPLSLRLLSRQAERIGKELILVAEDVQTREAAKREGVSVVASALALDDIIANSTSAPTEEEQATTHFHKPRGPRRRLFLAAFMLIVAAWALSYLFLPSAVVNMTLSATEESEIINATVSRRNTSLDLAGRRLPANTMLVELSTATTSTTSGKKSVPEAVAEGELTLLNKTGDEVAVPKGTRVRTSSGIQFAVQNDTVVPPGSSSISKARITALQPGLSGNVGPMAVNQFVDSQFVYRLAIFNELETNNGSDKEVKYVTVDDVQKMRSDVTSQLKTKGISQLLSSKKPTETHFPDTAVMEIVQELFDKQVNDETDSLNLSMRAKVTMLSVDNRYLEELSSEVLQSGIADDFELVRNSVSTSSLEVTRQDADSVDVRFHSKGKFTQNVDVESLKGELASKGRDEIMSYISRNYNLARPATIRFVPDWLPSAPHFGWRIDLQVETDG